MKLSSTELFDHADEYFQAGTDDRFQYFCAGVIYQGEEAFERVRSGDYGYERLGELAGGQFWIFENALYIPQEAYEVKNPDEELADAVQATGYQPAAYPYLYDLSDD